MDPDGARRLNRSSPSCLNSGAQRTDFFHGLPRRTGGMRLLGYTLLTAIEVWGYCAVVAGRDRRGE